jgi:hypothetical protein
MLEVDQIFKMEIDLSLGGRVNIYPRMLSICHTFGFGFAEGRAFPALLHVALSGYAE